MEQRQHRRKTDAINAKVHNRALDLFTYGTLTLTAVVLFTTMYWLLWPYKVMTITNAKMDRTVYTQGDSATYSNNYEKFMDIESETTRQFVDGLIFDAGNYSSNIPIGKGHVVREVLIPETLPPGNYHILVTLRYKVNPLRTIPITFQTDEFKVLPKEDDNGEAGLEP